MAHLSSLIERASRDLAGTWSTLPLIERATNQRVGIPFSTLLTLPLIERATKERVEIPRGPLFR